jgi:dipeptidase D
MTKSTLVVLVDVTATAEYDEEETPEGSVYNYRKGLNGGHSNGYSQGLGNANKIMNRLLFDGFDNFGLQIAAITGGSLRNAIPRESVAKVLRVCI